MKQRKDREDTVSSSDIVDAICHPVLLFSLLDLHRVQRV